MRSGGCRPYLQGYDLISVAKTGSGKTVGYLFPGITHIQQRANQGRPAGPTMIVLSPTRELATQIQAGGSFTTGTRPTSNLLLLLLLLLRASV